MIHHLLLPAVALPAHAEDALGPREAAVFAGLTAPKRREDWLLGRTAAKQLLREAGYGDKVEVLAHGDGAPEVWLAEERLPLSLSISHSHGVAFCALMEVAAGETLGADIEFVEARDPAFVTDFFTAREQAYIQAAPPDLRDALITATWSAKEAVLKALREGLRMDTRQVEWLFEPVLPAEGWAPFTIVIDPTLAHPRAQGEWAGWWRTWSHSALDHVSDSASDSALDSASDSASTFVLTLALRSG